MRKYLLGTYKEVLRYSNKKSAPYVLTAVSFAESCFFIVPPDILLLPMCLSAPKKAFFYALLCSIGSILGGIAGYYIGYFAYDLIGEKLINYFHYQNGFNHLKTIYHKYGAWAIFLTSYTPIPYKLITIFSGFTKINIWIFIIMSFTSRSIRFFLIAFAAYFFGEKAAILLENHIGKITLIGSIILLSILYWVLIH